MGRIPNLGYERLKNIFSFYQLNEKEKWEAAALSFDGEAEMWYEWEKHNMVVRSCRELKNLIFGRFRP